MAQKKRAAPPLVKDSALRRELAGLDLPAIGWQLLVLTAVDLLHAHRSPARVAAAIAESARHGAREWAKGPPAIITVDGGRRRNTPAEELPYWVRDFTRYLAAWTLAGHRPGLPISDDTLWSLHRNILSELDALRTFEADYRRTHRGAIIVEASLYVAKRAGMSDAERRKKLTATDFPGGFWTCLVNGFRNELHVLAAHVEAPKSWPRVADALASTCRRRPPDSAALRVLGTLLAVSPKTIGNHLARINAL